MGKVVDTALSAAWSTCDWRGHATSNYDGPRFYSDTAQLKNKIHLLLLL